MNTPNKLTLFRVIIAPVFMYLFILDNFYSKLTALVLFVLAAVTDYADGYYARKYGIVTGFGKFMDPLADKILVSCALIAFIALDVVSPLPVMIIVGREFAITGLRLLAAYQSVVIPPSYWAKVKTFLQLTIVGLVLAYMNLLMVLDHFGSPLYTAIAFDYPFYVNLLLWLTAVVTLITGISYVIKYFYMIKAILK